MSECNWPTCGCQNVHGAPWCKASTVVQPSPALAALAMRERAAVWCDTNAAYITEKWGPVFSADVHRDIAETIRALPTTFTGDELLAAAMQLPEVRAMEAFAHYFAGSNKDDVTVTLAGNPNVCRGVIDAARAALAPFMKDAS